MGAFFAVLLFFQALFLILLVLVQRGRGGGLAGALGGPGGSSAFGAKAGDTFTRITVIAVAIWILTCVAAAWWARNRSDVLGANTPPAASQSSESGAGGEDISNATAPPAEDEAAADAEPAEDTTAAEVSSDEDFAAEEEPAGE